MQRPWHWRPLPVFAAGVTALFAVLVMVTFMGDDGWLILAYVPPVIVIAVVQYRLTAISLGKR